MGTVTLDEVIGGILDGDFDDNFGEIYETLKLRGKRQSDEVMFTFALGDKVQFSDEVRDVLSGHTGTVTRPAGGRRRRILVKVDDTPITRALGVANREYNCPPRLLKKLPSTPARARKKRS